MKLSNSTIWSLFLVLWITSSWSQEGILTQFYNAEHYTNPAWAGQAGVPKVGLNYRKQWSRISHGFTTKALSADMPTKHFGLGLLITGNDAGRGTISKTQLMLSISKNIAIDSNNTLGLGLQAGILQTKIDPNTLQFDNQYDPASGYAATNNNGENFSTLSQIKPSMGSGIFWRGKIRQWHPQIAFALLQINRGNQSLLGSSTYKLGPEQRLTLEASKQMGQFRLTPMCFYSRKAKASQLQYGARVSFPLMDQQSLSIGTSLRNRDAWISYLGLALKDKYTLGFSYDVTISGLRKATKGLGAWEISMSMKLGKAKKTTKQNPLPEPEKLPQEDTSALLAPKTEIKLPLPDSLTQMHTPALKDTSKPQETPEQDGNKYKHVTSSDNPKPKAILYSTINPKQIKHRYYAYFDSDKSILKAQYKQELDSLVHELEKHHNYHILISGHTDSDGDGLYNIYLGDARAHEVMKYLIEKGVHKDSIETFTYGHSMPVAENDSEHKKALNRRVELLLVIP